MNHTEELLRLDETNFDEHIAELKELFGIEPNKSEDLSIRWTSSGGIEYRTNTRERKQKWAGKTFDCYVIEEPVGKFKVETKPRFYLRTHYDEGFILLIECVSEEQQQKWKEAVSADEHYFTREERYQERIINRKHSVEDTVYSDARDNAYIKYAIKRNRLNGSQIKELRKILKHFIDTVRIPRGQNDNNKFDVGQLQCELEELTKDEVVKKPRKKLVSA